MWVTPRRAARMVAQPLALDEVMAWLVRAAPTPPELVTALAGAHRADSPGAASPVSCAPCSRCVLLPMTRDGQRHKIGTVLHKNAGASHASAAAAAAEGGPHAVLGLLFPTCSNGCLWVAEFRDKTPARAALLASARAQADAAADAAGAGDRNAPAAKKKKAGGAK